GALDRYVVCEMNVVTQHHVRPHIAEGTDIDARSELCARFDERTRMNKSLGSQKNSPSARRLRRHHGRNFGLGNLVAFNNCFAGETPDVAALLELLHVDLEAVTGDDRLAELRV